MDSGLPIDLVALYQPMAAGIRWFVHDSGLQLGDTIVIMGCGQRGLADDVLDPVGLGRRRGEQMCPVSGPCQAGRIHRPAEASQRFGHLLPAPTAMKAAMHQYHRARHVSHILSVSGNCAQLPLTRRW